MTKSEWIEVFDNLWNHAYMDYKNAECNSKEELVSMILTKLADYMSVAIKELPDND